MGRRFNVSGIIRFSRRVLERLDRQHNAVPPQGFPETAPSGGNIVDDSELPGRALAFEQVLAARKREAAPADFLWYPYGAGASRVPAPVSS